MVATATQGVRACEQAAIQPEVQGLLDRAEQQQSERVKPGLEDDVLEANLKLAESLWDSRLRYCKTPVTADEQPLALVLTKLSR